MRGERRDGPGTGAGTGTRAHFVGKGAETSGSGSAFFVSCSSSLAFWDNELDAPPQVGRNNLRGIPSLPVLARGCPEPCHPEMPKLNHSWCHRVEDEEQRHPAPQGDWCFAPDSPVQASQPSLSLRARMSNNYGLTNLEARLTQLVTELRYGVLQFFDLPLVRLCVRLCRLLL